MAQQDGIIETSSPAYAGFKLFEIFEKRNDFLPDLGRFLEKRN